MRFLRFLRVLLVGLLFFCVLGINGVSQAADWYYVGQSANGDTFFIDNESLEKTSLQAKLWVRKGSPDGSTIYYLMGMDRESRTVKVISRIKYDVSGEVVEAGAVNSEWLVIVPDSPMEWIYSLLW